MNKRAIILVSFLFLIPTVGLAEITHPYTVDEKERVMFGDSVLIHATSTYLGLENYTHDYIDGWLHISYTYTHHFCCSANYPPRVYITPSDPKTLSTPQAKYNLPLYQLLPLIHPTDWYEFDIKFDVSGYSLVVKRSGETEIENTHIEISNLEETDWFALANLYLSNPYAAEFSMAFSPLPIRDKPVPVRTPVLIIPGIMGSNLNNEDGTEVWMNLSKMLVSSDDSYLNDLVLNPIGEQMPSTSLNTTEVIRKTGKEDFFNGLVLELKKIGYVEEKNLFFYPYDWRRDIDQLTHNLNNKIEEIKNITRFPKVEVISHSMGGLIVKKYLENYGGDSIDKFIDVGTPHLGTPKAFKILSYGDNLNASILFGIFGLNSNRIKSISQNLPAVYQLLPSLEYGSYIVDLDDIDQNGATGQLSFTEAQEFMKNTGRNGQLIDRAGVFHEDVDFIDPSNYGVETYNIVGCGIPTLDKVFVLNKEDGGEVEYNISFGNGDGTVPLRSAEAMPALRTYYANNVVHALMPSTEGIRKLIAQILNSTTTQNLNISSYKDISDSGEGCDIPNGKIVSFHSPVDLHIYDEDGNHVGPTTTADLEHNIPEVNYEVIEGNKFAFLPDGKEYRIVGNPTGLGTFNVRIQTIADGKVVGMNYWNQIPIKENSEVNFTVWTSNPTQISGLYPSAILDESEAQDLEKPITEMSIKGNKFDDDTFISSVQITFTANDNRSGVLKTEYSLNDGKSWVPYKEKFVINDRGGVGLWYRSIDKAGNMESIKTETINIIYPGNSGKKK